MHASNINITFRSSYKNPVIVDLLEDVYTEQLGQVGGGRALRIECSGAYCFRSVHMSVCLSVHNT